MKLALLSGLLIGTSYIPFPPWALIFAFVPLWTAVGQTSSIRRAFALGWVTQFVLTLIGFHWVAYTAVEFGHLPWILGLLALLGFCGFASLHVALGAALWKAIEKRTRPAPLLRALGIASATALCERLYPMIFPWNLGYAWLPSGMPLIQTADIFGFEGLSTLTFLANGLLYFALHRSTPSQRVRPALGVFLGFLLLSAMGLNRGTPWSPSPEDPQLKALVVQANIGNLEKYYAERGSSFRTAIIEKYLVIAQEAYDKNPSADLFVFPETAMPMELESTFQDHALNRSVRDFVIGKSKPLFTGAYSKDLGSSAVYNGVFLLDSQGDVVARYRKSILLAFGEYFPGSDTFPILKNLVDKYVPAISHFGRGEGPTVFSSDHGRLGPLICYEGLYPLFVSAVVEKGAEVLINLTNDSWFGTYFEPHQHMWMTLARAIEARRPLIRATNTGITTAILADGTTLEKSDQNGEWYGLFTVPYKKNPEITFYSQHGDWIPHLLGLFFFTIVGLSYATTRPR